METQVPSGVPSTQSRKWSQIAPATDSAGVRFLACESLPGQTCSLLG